MATVRPFHGLRFSNSSDTIADCVAPPYDVLSQEQRDEYAAKSKNNIVHLTLPEGDSSDRSKYVKYAKSAAQLEEWRRNGTVKPEQNLSFYRYTQTFTIPGLDGPNASKFTRTSLIVLLKVEPYENGVVLPHEQTFPKHKEDRLRLLEATRSHLECIFGLYEDDDNAVHTLIAGAPGTQLGTFTTAEDGIVQTLERIDNASTVAAIEKALEPKRLWIADGHHRYETALNFRQAQGDKEGLVAEDFMMMAVDSMTDPGLVLLPTHRILKQSPCSGEELKSRMAEGGFTVQEADNGSLMTRIEADRLAGKMSFGVALPGGRGFVASSEDIASLANKVEGNGSEMLKSLDVSVLHGYIFEKLLGLTGLDFFGYTRIESEAIAAVESGSPASFLMNPPTVDDMRLIALQGEKMPQKSTYYYPKLLSGLVMWSLKDF